VRRDAMSEERVKSKKSRGLIEDIKNEVRSNNEKSDIIKRLDDIKLLLILILGVVTVAIMFNAYSEGKNELRKIEKREDFARFTTLPPKNYPRGEDNRGIDEKYGGVLKDPNDDGIYKTPDIIPDMNIYQPDFSIRDNCYPVKNSERVFICLA
jgi:hypothetical protein